MEVSVKREVSSVSQCLTLTAVIHSARSWADKLLHSRRTDGLRQECAVTACPNRAAAARASFTNRKMVISRDGRDVPCESKLLDDGKKGRRGGVED